MTVVVVNMGEETGCEEDETIKATPGLAVGNRNRRAAAAGDGFPLSILLKLASLM
ncbi:hypothetical protein HSX37_10020|uniref:hypothetical protein n=1 Tax=Dendrosporobacter quercicolus TaxID=146817 RepID=UPI00156FCCE8|nr:hypothetical protein [Dendrosporobacter quercicolus]NSL48365.1 hypothetical protein [Dendrosporobacter quercicolus DSM 1736]